MPCIGERVQDGHKRRDEQYIGLACYGSFLVDTPSALWPGARAFFFTRERNPRLCALRI